MQKGQGYPNVRLNYKVSRTKMPQDVTIHNLWVVGSDQFIKWARVIFSWFHMFLLKRYISLAVKYWRLIVMQRVKHSYHISGTPCFWLCTRGNVINWGTALSAFGNLSHEYFRWDVGSQEDPMLLFCCGRTLVCFPGETPSEMWTVRGILIGFWSRALPAKNKSRLEIVCHGSLWQKHLQSCHWKCLFCWVYMANRIQISEQRNGLLSRLDIVDGMYAGSTYHKACFCTPPRGCHAGWQHFQLQCLWETSWSICHH